MRRSPGLLIQSRLDHFSYHLNKVRMCVDRPGTDYIQTIPFGNPPCLSIQIVQDLDVVAHKADGNDDRIACPLRGKVLEYLTDIRLQPRNLGWAATTLIGDRPVFLPNTLRDQTRAFFDLPDVFPAARHGGRHTMGGKDQRSRPTAVRRERRERLSRQIGKPIE